MRDSIDDDDIERAYRTAVDTSTDVAGTRRRRAAVLEAVAGLEAVQPTPVHRHSAAPGDRSAVNAVHRHPSASWWRGLAAACVFGISSLVVLRLQHAPETPVETERRADAARVAAPVPARESTAARVADAAPRQSGLATAPAPLTDAPAPVTDAPRHASTARTTPSVGGSPSTVPEPVAKAARSAFPGNGNETPVAAGRIRQSEAATADVDAATRETPRVALPSSPILAPDAPERRERSTARTEQSTAAPQEAHSAAAPLPPSHAAAPAGNAVAKNSPTRDDAARAGKTVERAPREGLLAAVKMGDIEAAHTILQSAEPDAERDADGRTALAIAVLRADVPLVKLLLASGANRHAVDRFGQTPVSYADASADTMLRQAFGRP